MSAEFLTFPAWSDELPDDWQQALEDRSLMWSANGRGVMLASARDHHKEHGVLRVVDQTTIWAVFTRDQVSILSEWSDKLFRERLLAWVGDGGLEAPLPRFEDAVRLRLADLLVLESEDQVLYDLTNDIFWRVGNPISWVWRISTRTAIAANRELKYKNETNVFPYLRYRADHYRQDDDCPHHDWNGLIFEIGDPVWEWMMPPNSMVCNCRVEQVSEYRMRSEGWRKSAANERPKRPRSNGFDRSWAKLLPEAASIHVPLIDMRPRNT